MRHVVFLLILFLLGSPLSAQAELNWSGYFDFEYLSKKRNFQQHHLSTFLQYNSDLVTIFSEIEYEYAPQFSGASDGKSTQTATGKFLVETAWADLNFQESFKLRLGRHLVPTWWQTNHYPNIVLTVTRPQIIKNIFPDADTGVMAHGSFILSSMKLGYKVWTGNGGGEDNSSKDNKDEESSIGARIEIEDLSVFDFSHIGFMYMSQPNGATPSLRTDLWGMDLILERSGIGINSAFHWSNEKRGYFFIPSYKYDFENGHSLTAYYAFDNKEDNLTTVATFSRKRYYGLRYGFNEDLSVKVEYLKTKDSSEEFLTQFAYFFN